MQRRDFLNTAAVATGSSWLAGRAAHATEGKRPPNVILIMADDIGYECFGCYGSTQYRTPNLDRMAQRGMRFTHGYARPSASSRTRWRQCPRKGSRC